MQKSGDLRRTCVSVIVTLFALLVVGIADIPHDATPVIVKGPPSEVFYRKGDCLLPWEAEGVPEPNISWYKDGQLISSICPLSRNSSVAVEGRYHCRAQNKYGVALSNVTLVREAVFRVGRDRRQPKTDDFEPPIILHCDHVYSVPAATITWYTTKCDCKSHGVGGNKDTYAGNDVGCTDCVITNYKPPCRPCKDEVVSLNDSISLLKNGSLLLFGLPMGDRTFRCKAYNRILKKTKYGSYARVIVEKTPLRHKKNYFSDDTTTVLEGESATLRCVFAQSTSAQVVWKKNAQDLNETSVVQIKNNGIVLLFYSVTTGDQGTYSCNVRGSTTTHTFQLKVHRKPFLLENLVSQTVEEGQDALFSCRGTGRPSPTVTWLYNGDPVEDRWNNSFATQDNGKELTLKDVSLDDAGVVLCNVTNVYESQLHSASLTVIPRTEIPTTTSSKPPVITETKTTQMVKNDTVYGSPIRGNNTLVNLTISKDLKPGTTDDWPTPTKNTKTGLGKDYSGNTTSQRHSEAFKDGLENVGGVTVFIWLPVLFIIIVSIVLAVVYCLYKRHTGKDYEVEKREAALGLSPMRDKDYDSDDSGIGNDEKDGLKKKGKQKLERDVKTLNCHI